jgi:hypothetical protein
MGRIFYIKRNSNLRLEDSQLTMINNRFILKVKGENKKYTILRLKDGKVSPLVTKSEILSWRTPKGKIVPILKEKTCNVCFKRKIVFIKRESMICCSKSITYHW